MLLLEVGYLTCVHLQIRDHRATFILGENDVLYGACR
jgi:hypothetical protein